MAPRRRCPVCGSKQWHKEPSSGLITCSEGHVLQNYRNETREVTELGPHALRKRKLKSGRKRKEKQSKADPNLYHGERARYHYFQCLQLILRMQVVALTKIWGLPPEFEVVCRDVWALHLNLLPNPPPAEPLHFARDEDGENASEQGLRARGMPPTDDVNDDEPNHPESPEDVRENLRSLSSSSSSDEEDDPEMAELMRENSETSSSEDEDAPKDHPTAPLEDVKRRRSRRRYDAPASNIAVLMVACWMLRLPVMYMDFIRLAEAYGLPYLDPVGLLPNSLTSHLTKHTTKALSPPHTPTCLLLHSLASRLARLMYASFDIFTPEMNAPPTLWRAVRAVCGTPTLYILTKKVARVLSIPVTLHRSLSSPLKRIKMNDPEWHKYDSAVPEVSLIAAVIVVLKLVYGLDGKTRLPKEGDDPACAMPQLSEFLAAIEELDKKDTEDNDAFSTAKQISVLDMDDDALDKYIEFCELALLRREDRRNKRNAATDFFPLEPKQAQRERNVSLRDQQEPVAFFATGIDEDNNCLRPGQDIAIYNTLDVLGSLPEEYEIVIRRAAHWSGVPEDYVAGLVERFERRLVRWWDGVRKKEREQKAGQE